MIRHWLILFALVVASGAGLGYFLDPFSRGPDSLALVLYMFFWAPLITYLGALEEHPRPIRRAMRRAREARHGR
jgi:hypothetical protein